MSQYKNRLAKLKSDLLKSRLDGLIVTSTSNITYLTGFANFSIVEREAFLLVSDEGDYVLTDGRYSEAVKKVIKHFKLIEISAGSFEKIFKKLLGEHHISKVGIEEDNLTVLEYKKLASFCDQLKHFDIHHHCRLVKDATEVALIKKACQIGDKAFEFILPKIKPGVTEKEIALEIEFYIKGEGADISFSPIVAFSENSSVPHHQTGEKVLEDKRGQFILLDFGVKFQNYCSDMTRTLFFGKASMKQKMMYQTVLDSQNEASKFLQQQLKQKGKIFAREVDKVVRNFITAHGYPSIPHSLGHGIGLDVHEPPALSPKSKHELKTGMIFSIEPGIYLPDFGGVRIEDLFVIENNNLRQLTHSTKNLIEL